MHNNKTVAAGLTTILRSMGMSSTEAHMLIISWFILGGLLVRKRNTHVSWPKCCRSIHKHESNSTNE
jgi:hypothetical protein